jgi:uncharacterized membrane protein
VRVPRGQTGRPTDRLEAFSDGVIAIAITLLTLDIHVPPHDASGDASLWSRLGALWPNYLAFATSFIAIAILWINHHAIFAYVVRTDYYLLLINLFLLFATAVIPFTTSLAADYLGHDGERAAVMVYSGWFFLIPVGVNLLWWHPRRAGLIDPEADPKTIARMTRRYLLGLPVYAALFLVSIASPSAAIGGFGALALLYAFPNQP